MLKFSWFSLVQQGGLYTAVISRVEYCYRYNCVFIEMLSNRAELGDLSRVMLYHINF